jgi:hypothetical protein
MTRRRQRNPGVSSSKRQIAALRDEMMGHKLKPAIDPPTFVERPWNDWTFSRTNSTNASFEVSTITVGDIIDQIRARCNINAVGANSSDNYIQLRIQRAQVWCTVAETLLQPDLAVSFFELSGDNKVVRQQLRDLGTLNRPAKVGYQYPVTDSQDVLDNDNAGNIVLQSTATSTGSVVTYRVKLLWRSGYQST